MNLISILKKCVYKLLVPPQGVDNTTYARNTYIDTQGLAGVMFVVQSGLLAAAVGSTTASAALKIEECDTTSGSFTDVTGAALSVAIPATADDKVYGIFIDLRKTHKRYMQFNAPTAGNGSATTSLLTVLAIGFPKDTAPASASAMGLAELIEA
jgi:hypothetical protein